MSANNSTLEANLVTCSFAGDFEVCQLLCESVDRFVPAEIGHTLYVPARDVALFSALVSPRRTIATQESLLPRWFWKIPMPPPAWRARLRLPRRNMYLTPFSLPVRGWIAQQIMKLAAAARSEREIVVHVDSDCAFIRPLTMEHLVRDGRVRLYRDPDMVPMASHRQWHAAAGNLLGLPKSNFYSAEYIDQIVVWRASVVRDLLARLQSVSGKSWEITLAREPHFAEYILYGVFADCVAGLDAAGLFAEPQSLCLSRWSGRIDSEDQARDFIDALHPAHVSCMIQSTIDMTIEERRRLFETASAFAAEQESRRAPEPVQ